MSQETPEERARRLAEERAKNEAALEASKRGLVRGGLYGLGVGLVATLLGNRFSPAFRALRVPVKAAFVSMATFGGATFASEHVLYRLTRPAASHPVDASATASTGWRQTLVDHRLGIVSSVVALAVLGTGWRIAQNKHTTGTQKFMNIRLYGQMAGLLAIGVLMGLSVAKSIAEEEEGRGRRQK